MRLEPIAERTAQHARGGARRCAFCNVMPAIEEVCGIARIEGHRGESWERRELGARPLPAISDEIVDAKRACARGMGADRGRIPGVKIEISVTLGWRLVAPGIVALLRAFRSAVGSTMELRFAGKLAPEPIRVGCGFGVTGVHRPFQGKADFAKHGAI